MEIINKSILGNIALTNLAACSSIPRLRDEYLENNKKKLLLLSLLLVFMTVLSESENVNIQ